jgi:hypothetical protein
MKRTTMLGMVILAALAIGGANAISVSASGHEFIASKTGKTKSKSTNSQIFSTTAGTIECLKASGTGEITALTSATHKETITYSECSGLGKKLTVSAAAFEFNANGPAKLESQVVIKGPGLGCEILIEPQTDESLGYETVSGDLKSKASISSIKIIGTGGLCGGDSEASYSGTIKGELEGGTLEWK